MNLANRVNHFILINIFFHLGFSTSKNEIIIDKLFANTSQEQIYDDSNQLIQKEPIDVYALKELYNKYSTSTFLNNKESIIYFRSDKEGYYGKYLFLTHTSDGMEKVGELIVFNTEYPWNYDNNTDIFIEITSDHSGITIFDNIKIGHGKESIEKKIGKPYKIVNDLWIYKFEPSNQIILLKYKDNRLNWFKIGRYKKDIIDHIEDYLPILL